MTRATDLAAVGQGLAAGCLSLGALGVTSSKLALEFAFGRAWRSWPPASRFPTIKARVDRNDVLRIVRDLERRRSAYIATWVDEGPWLRPQLRASWDLTDAAEMLADEGASWDEWLSLAQRFLDGLKEEEVLRG